MSRKYESGSQKRKTAQDKVERQNSLLKKKSETNIIF